MVGATGAVGAPAAGVPEAEAGLVGDEVVVAARVRAVRDHGAAVFVDLVEDGHRVQVVLDAQRLGADRLRHLARVVDVGDLVRVSGVLGSSRAGTPSLLADACRIDAKALRPLPFGRLTDPAARGRDRSADLLVNPGGADLLRVRSAAVRSVRHALEDRGFLEVETPVLQAVHGGASARPFRTRSNAHGVDLSLRIAPELYLKRLVVAGMGPVFELGRNFRNEGADATHNPEFSALEVYEPGGDYTTMRHLAEDLVRAAARAVHGREVVPVPRAPEQVREGLAGVELLDVSGPWPVVDVLDAVSAAVGRPVGVDTDVDELRALARRHGVEVGRECGPGGVVEELYSALVEPATSAPTFYVDFPVETSPLTRPHRSRPGLAERWDLVAAGTELATAYTELTDPLEQRSRLVEQSARAAAGDPEAMEVDEDFLRALELGMPPTGGLGVGVDRLVMVLTNSPIRAVLGFPFVRPLEAVTR